MRNASNAHKKDEFLEIYDLHFSKFKDKNPKFLEIGVQYGGSLYIWRDYFKKLQLTGVDILPECEQYESDDTEIIIGDQSKKEFLETLGSYDIIVDDGGHTMHQQRLSFEILFPKLNPGGIYVIEDLHTSYWQQFQDTTPTTEMLKEFIDDINAEATKSPRTIEGLVKENRFDIASMHVYESVVVIHKKCTSDQK